MEASEIILEVLLVITSIGLVFLIIMLTQEESGFPTINALFAILAITCFSYVTYQIGYRTSKYDIYRKIDKNISIKKTIDFKEYKLMIQKKIK